MDTAPYRFKIKNVHWEREWVFTTDRFQCQDTSPPAGAGF